MPYRRIVIVCALATVLLLCVHGSTEDASEATNEALTKANIQYEALAREHARGELPQEAKRDEPEQQEHEQESKHPDADEQEHEENGQVSRMNTLQDEDSASVQVGEGAGFWRRRRRSFSDSRRRRSFSDSRRRRTKSPTRPPTQSPTQSPTQPPTQSPTQSLVAYYAFPTGTPSAKQVETCRKLMMKPEVQDWLQMTTRKDAKASRKQKQRLVSKQELARAAASSADAALKSAIGAEQVMNSSKYSKSVMKLIADVSKEGSGGGNHKKMVCGRKLLGEPPHLPSAPGPASKPSISNQDSVRDVPPLGELLGVAEAEGAVAEAGVRTGFWRRRRRSAHRVNEKRKKDAKSGRLRASITRVKNAIWLAKCEAKGQVIKAKRSKAIASRSKKAATEKVRKIKKKLKGITSQLKKFRRTKFGGWICSRIERKGTAYGASCIKTQTDTSNLVMCKATLRLGTYDEEEEEDQQEEEKEDKEEKEKEDKGKSEHPPENENAEQQRHKKNDSEDYALSLDSERGRRLLGSGKKSPTRPPTRRPPVVGIAQYLKQVKCGNSRRTTSPSPSPNLAENSEIGQTRKSFDASFEKKASFGKLLRLARQGSNKKKKQEGIGKTKKNNKKKKRTNKCRCKKKKRKEKKRTTKKSNHGMNTCTVAKICDPIASGTAVKIRKADLKAECLMH